MSPLALKANADYIPALDGLRAISIVLVLVSHAGLQNLVPGGLGVLVFFVISGFLLTRQMIVEIERSGTLNVRTFYLRRFLRLAPALCAYIALFSALFSWLGADIQPMHILSGLFYFANYYSIYHGYPAYSPFPILWSLAVEEHYYIGFPFFILLFRHRPQRSLPWLICIIIAILVWRMIIAHSCASDIRSALCGLPGHERIFHGTDTIFDCILYGAFAALASHYYSGKMKQLFLNKPAFLIAIATLLFTLCYRDPFFRETLRFSLQAFSVALIMVHIVFNRVACRKYLSHPLLVLTGRWSYSLYLFHFGMLNLVEAMRHSALTIDDPVGIALYAAGTFAMASGSYYLIEKPMAKLRKRYHHQLINNER